MVRRVDKSGGMGVRPYVPYVRTMLALNHAMHKTLPLPPMSSPSQQSYSVYY
jgi:hypothetical protein